MAGLRSGAEELGGIPCGAAGSGVRGSPGVARVVVGVCGASAVRPVGGRLAPASWNLAVKTLSAFYSWAAAEGRAGAVPFSYSPQVITRPDGSRVEITRNLATVRTGKAHASRKYLERPYTELLMNALAGNDPAGQRDPMFAGRQTGRNAAVIGLALASGLRVGEFTHLTVYEVPALPPRRTGVPVPLVLAPPTTKGGKGRSSWIDYDALARVHDYIAFDRAAATDGSRWQPNRAVADPERPPTTGP